MVGASEAKGAWAGPREVVVMPSAGAGVDAAAGDSAGGGWEMAAGTWAVAKASPAGGGAAGRRPGDCAGIAGRTLITKGDGRGPPFWPARHMLHMLLDQ